MWTKKSLRQEMRSRLETLSPDERHQKSLRIEEKLFKLGAFRKARTVCFYVGTDTEVDTAPMIEKTIAMGKRVLLPRVNLENKELKLFEIKDIRSQLRPGSLGILEPDPTKAKAASQNDVECVIVPGLAFDAVKGGWGAAPGFMTGSWRSFPRMPSKLLWRSPSRFSLRSLMKRMTRHWMKC